MIARKHLLAIAVASFLAGCGGGSDSLGVDSGAAPQRVAAQAALLPGTSVTPEAAAEQLFAFAEGTFQAIFPGHPTTGSAGPFAYRAYPGGIFIGVVVTEDSPFTYGGVYLVGLFGGTLAEPHYYAQLTDLITPVDPGAGSGGSGNGCYDLALFDTPNTHLVETFEYSGFITGSQTIDSLVGGVTLFEGQQARETALHTTGTNTSQGTTVSIDTMGTAYANRTGDAEMTQYGSVFTASFAGFTATTRTVFSPPTVDRQYSLAIGESVTTTQTGNANFKVPAIFIDQNTAINGSTTVKYVGQEQVIVPAGTYNTCKFESTTTGSAVVTTSWVMIGKGIPVQTSSNGAQAVTLKATAISLNGQSL